MQTLIITTLTGIFFQLGFGCLAADVVTIGSGQLGTIGETDSSIEVSGLGQPTIIERVFAGPDTWAVPISGSNWVSPFASNGIATSAPVADFTFLYDFDLPSFEPGSASLEMSYYADNSISSLLLNGNPLSISSAFHNYNNIGQTMANESSYFNEGANLLAITVTNTGGAGFNPVGLNFSGEISFEAIPESSSFAVLGLSAGGLVSRRRREHRA